jgi:hypothetical protein
LIALTWAQVEKTNADRELVVNGLDHSAKPERQTIKLELGFDSTVNSHRKPIVRANPASAHAEVEDAPGDLGADIDEQDSGLRVIE